MTRRTDWILYLATALLATAFTVAGLQLWAADFAVPWGYSGDGIATAAHFKTVIETGWYEYQPLLGAPYGQVFHDFPTADNLHMIAILLLSLLTKDYATAFNGYFVLGFPLIAITALWFFRKVGISRLIAAALAVLFAIAPYHFIRGEGHLWLASYYVVPLSLALVVMTMRGDALWGFRETPNRALRILTGPGARTVAILALTATAQSYYAVFFLVLLAFAGVVRLIRSGDWRRFWGAAIAGGVTVIGMLVNMLPDILYSALNGANDTALGRGHIESEIYALKLTQLLLPWSGHRNSLLHRLRELYDQTYPLPSEQPALGTIGAFGLVALFLMLAYFAFARRSSKKLPEWVDSRFTTLGHLAALTFVAFIFSTLGGLATIISFVTTSLRGWNRMSIFIALFCLAAVGILVDLLLLWLAKKGSLSRAGLRVRAITAAALLLIVGFYDQTPANNGASFGPTKAQYTLDEEWVAAIEGDVSAGSIILQLPYLPYPEYITNGVLSSDALIPYLHSDDLRWSAGGIKGRPRADWPGVLETFDGDKIARLAAAAGIAGIYVDRRAIGDGWEQLEDEISETTGTSPRVSDDERYSFFVLDEVREDLESQFTATELDTVEGEVFLPPTFTTVPSFNAQLDENQQVVLSANTSRPFITLLNATDEPIESVLEVSLAVPPETEDADSITIRLPDGTSWAVALSDGVGTAKLRVTVPAGESVLGFEITGSAVSSQVPVRIRSIALHQSALLDFLAR